ncbi:developmentally-regulated protein [Acrasis kona]|uniref:Developmentally-regulated protein n=1 Tax=Acrasis kona TaxID=1008807 RepID=A0AAW2Z538_9EUKA
MIMDLLEHLLTKGVENSVKSIYQIPSMAGTPTTPVSPLTPPSASSFYSFGLGSQGNSPRSNNLLTVGSPPSSPNRTLKLTRALSIPNVSVSIPIPSSPGRDIFLNKLSISCESKQSEFPSMIVFDNEGNITMKWESQYQNKHGDPTSKFINEFVQYYFSREDNFSSVTNYMSEHLCSIFPRVLEDPDLRSMFDEHLCKERNEESLDFIEKVDILQSILSFDNTESHEADNAYFVDEVMNVYQDLIPNLNISNEVKQKVEKYFRNGRLDVGAISEMMSTKRLIVFQDVANEVKASLQYDSFVRYYNSTLFQNTMMEHIPFLSYNKTYSTSSLVRRSLSI